MAYRQFILPDDFCTSSHAFLHALDPRWLVVIAIPLSFAGCSMGTLQPRLFASWIVHKFENPQRQIEYQGS